MLAVEAGAAVALTVPAEVAVAATVLTVMRPVIRVRRTLEAAEVGQQLRLAATLGAMAAQASLLSATQALNAAQAARLRHQAGTQYTPSQRLAHSRHKEISWH